MKEQYKVSHESQAPKEQKDIANRLISESKSRLSQEEQIRKQEKKVSQHGFVNKLMKGLGNLPKGKLSYRPILKKVARPTLKIEEREIPSVLNDPNRFFKSTYEKEKRSLFLEW